MKVKILSVVVLFVFTSASLFGWQMERKNPVRAKSQVKPGIERELPNLSGDAAKEYLKKEGLYDSLIKSVRAQKAAPEPTEEAFSQIKKLTASDGGANDYFGHSISISGNTAIVGAFNDSSGSNTGEGSAYVFERNAGGANNWSQVKKLTASDAAFFDQFGFSVAIDGDTIIVGAPKETVFSNAAGAVYVYGRDAGGAGFWGQVKKITPSDGAIEDYFGHSVDISGDTIIVGSSGDDINSNLNQGSANVYQRDAGGANNWGQVKKIVASDGAEEAQFGWAVGISGDTAIIGLFSDAAYIVERDVGGADNWGVVKKLNDPDGANGLFGYAVAIDGNTAIVGAYGRNVGGNLFQGAAYVFEKNAGGANNWGRLKILTASDGAAADNFGWSMAASGKLLIVGAPFDDGVLPDEGSAYIFERNTGGADNWGEVKKIRAADAGQNDQFGHSVSISGDAAIVGSPRDDVGANQNQGSAYIFEQNAGGAQNWGEVKKLIAADGAAGDLFGISVAVSNDDFLVGAYLAQINQPFADGKTNFLPPVEQGSAYVFRGTSLVPTAANVSVSGRVLTVSGSGIGFAQVILTDESGTTRTSVTNSFGFYRFENVQAGETYVFSVRHKEYQFAPQVVSVNDEISELDFITEK